MGRKIRNENSWIFYFLIIGVIIALVMIGYNIGYEKANPCLEYSNDCEVVCFGEGTPAFDCYEECECLKRKYN